MPKASPRKASSRRASIRKKAGRSSRGVIVGRKKKTSQKKARPGRKNKRPICFVLSPFGTYYERYYDKIYAPAIEAANLEPHRADDLYRPSAIVQDIWTYVNDAVVMLADLTDKNPNVFYELGLAHALRKPVVLLTQAIEDVPFDLRQLRIVNYDTNEPDWADTLREDITTAIGEAVAAPSTATLQPFQHHPAPQAAKTEDQDVILRQLTRDMNQLRSLVLERRVPLRPSIPARHAEGLIDRYLQEGMSRKLIIERLRLRGVPRVWVEGRIDRFKASERQVEDQSNETVSEESAPKTGP